MSANPAKTENTFHSNGGKIIWAACEDFDTPSAKRSVKTILEEADTPNIDRLCHHSETGLLEADREVKGEPPRSIEEFTRMRSMAITNRSSGDPLEALLRFGRYERVSRLGEFEAVLGANWEDRDFFYIHLDGKAHLSQEAGEPSGREWIEMIDAWIPGFMARFQPTVFALSGDIGPTLSGESDPVPAMVHSKRSRSRRTKGFNHPDCEDGQLGGNFDLSRWLLLLQKHAGRLDAG